MKTLRNILIVVLVIMALGGIANLSALMGFRMNIPGGLSILPGLVVALIWVGTVNRIPFRQFLVAAADRSILSMLILVAAIMVFKGVMTDSRAVVEVRSELLHYRIPPLLIIALMPLLSGFITGINKLYGSNDLFFRILQRKRDDRFYLIVSSFTMEMLPGIRRLIGKSLHIRDI